MRYILLVIIIIIIGLWHTTTPKYETKNIKVGNVFVKVEISDNAETKEQGLSGRENLPKNNGMLFVYNKSLIPSYWMKEMNFPLDFIWINNGKVVELTENVQPADYQPPKTLSPKESVDTVLEVNGGFVKNNSIIVGDSAVVQ